MNTVLITGATSGIGADLAKCYAEKGFQVYACGRNKDKLAELGQRSKNIIGLAFDITDPTQIEQACEQVENLELLILNAGDCEYIDDATAFDGQLFARIVQVNLIAIGHLLASLIPKMQHESRIVFVSSSATILPFPRAEAYGASKAGVDYLANSLRIDLAKSHVNVTLVHPGFIKTPLTDKNTFSMPFIMSSDEAAKRIVHGVEKGSDYLHFPKRFTYFLKLLACMPNWVWRTMAKRSIH